MLIGMPVYDDVDMLDVCGPYEMFRWAKFDVELAAAQPGKIRFRNGFNFEVTKSFADASDYDVLWVPGGDPDALACRMEDKTFLDFLTAKAARATYVCSVCEGALLLAAAGLIDGYTVTTHWQFIACLQQRFKKVLIADGFPRFHLDRNRLTGGGISSGLDEALKLIELLSGTAAAQGVQRSTQYYPQPPVCSKIEPSDYCPVPTVCKETRRAQ
jgi:transcriptional regulator GlxA family with amidase domain